MTLPPALRKAALTAHIVCSVGWLGAVAASLALSIVGLVSGDPERVGAIYLTLELVGWGALIPLAIASLGTGLVQAFGTPWGLFRHYWVIFKLLINVFATVMLLLYMETLGHFANVARAASPKAVEELRDPSPALHAGGALVLLLVATTLSVYKPRGRTRFGRGIDPS